MNTGENIKKKQYGFIRLTIILSTLLFNTSAFGYQVVSSQIQYFYYEDNSQFLRAQFTVEDDNGSEVTSDVVRSITLFDATGSQIASDYYFNTRWQLSGNYNPGTGQVEYSSSELFWDSKYRMPDLPVDLPDGVYSLVVNFDDDTHEIIDRYYNKADILPVGHDYNLEGNYTPDNGLTLNWDEADLTGIIEPEYRIHLKGYNNGVSTGHFHVNAPTGYNFDSIEVSQDIVDLLNADQINVEISLFSENSRYRSSEITIGINSVSIPGSFWLLGSGLIGILRLRYQIPKFFHI